MRKMGWLWISLLMTMLAVPAPAHAGDDAGIAAMLTLQAVDQRVSSIGYRLAAHGGDLCPEAAPLSGLEVHDISQYGGGDQADAVAAFGGGPWPKLLAVAEGSAAARAGLKPNDSVVAIEGAAVPAAPAARNDVARATWTLDLIERALADGKLTLSLERDGKPLTLGFTAERGCSSRFQTRISDALQSRADGRYVEINTGLVAFAADDAELAAVIAHEMAHNILHHRDRLDAQGMSRGVFQSFGKNARMMRDTEVEADRFSVYLLDRAGYDLAAAPRFWSRFLKARGTAFKDGTHPGRKERLTTIQTEIDRIQAARVKGEVARWPG